MSRLKINGWFMCDTCHNLFDDFPVVTITILNLEKHEEHNEFHFCSSKCYMENGWVFPDLKPSKPADMKVWSKIMEAQR